MLGHSPRQKADADPASLLPWLRDVLLRPEDSVATDVQVRLRGNILHVLCESAEEGPPRDFVLMRLVRSLMEPDVKTRFETDFPHIYQIYVYSRRSLEPKPLWSAPIYLDRLEHHLERLVQQAADAKEVAETAQKLDLAVSSEQLSDISLARQGDSGAIARYLSEALSTLNVGVQVNARVVPGKARRARTVVSAKPTDELVAEAKSDEASPTETPSDQNALTKKGLTEAELVSRLWIFCEASYSPDPLLIAEPIAERLRQLQLNRFQDAVITIQVKGEAASEWRLRVDLTPPEEMLREWGRWGDLPALAKLINQLSQPYGLKLIPEVKKETLHLISYPVTPVDSETGRLMDSVDSCRDKIDVDGLADAISDLMREISPQGLQRAMLYGPSTDDISPEWLRGIDLPGLVNPELTVSTVTLAAKGNMPALAYCLTRALNPDIEDQLATGGVRVQLLVKDQLLHVMADGPVCPPKSAIVPLMNQTLQQLDVPDIEGVRFYGRRAGQKQPIWSYGHDFTQRSRLVPEAKPEFAASDAYAGELITPVGDEVTAGLAALEPAKERKVRSLLRQAMQFVLVKSQVFVPVEENARLRSTLPKAFQAEGGKMALVWAAAGLLLTVQFDVMVRQALKQAATPVRQAKAEVIDGKGVERVKPSRFNDELADLEWNASNDEGWNELWADRSPLPDDETDDETFGEAFGEASNEGSERPAWELAEASRRNGYFNSDEPSFDFTASAIDDDELIYSPQQEFVSTSTLLANSSLPSFRSQQLDEKLALYRQRVAQSGPPDVLVIGSSRALRGVDPAALRTALAGSGYEGLSIFNFGVNGATAQVVDLVVRRLIPPDQLPQVIVWADGARAFNSGRTDVTFDAIATSDGYQQLELSESGSGGGIEDLAISSIADQLTLKARATDRQLSDGLGQFSAAYTHRGKIRSAMAQSLSQIAPSFAELEASTRAGDTPTGAPAETSLIDYDGFLALSTRFNPATYYQDHARVAGAYDGDYKDFQLQGRQENALEAMLRFTREYDVPVVFVNTPLTDEYLDSHRTRSERLFQQYMLQVADTYTDFTFRDLGRLWPQRYDYFSDPSHLNRYGAYQVSQRLSRDPMIPWPQPLVQEEASAR